MDKIEKFKKLKAKLFADMVKNHGDGAGLKKSPKPLPEPDKMKDLEHLKPASIFGKGPFKK